LGNYWPILRSAMDSDDEARHLALQATNEDQPVIQRFKVPFATGIVQRVIALISLSAIDSSSPRISGIVLSSLCPSIGIHGRDKRIFGDSPLGPKITDEGYRYARFVYGPWVPLGTTRVALAQKLGVNP